MSRQTVATRWSGHIVWGNHRLGSGLLVASAKAWHTDVIWGSTTTPDGHDVTWGRTCAAEDCSDAVTGAPTDENIVWGTVSDGENIVWGTNTTAVNIVWGTSKPDALPDIIGRLKPLVVGTPRGGCAEMSIRRKAVWGVS